MTDARRRIGFIGLGMMGWPMAANLVKGGFAVQVFDAVPGRADSFAAEIGGEAAADAAGVADCPLVVTMLPNSAIVTDVLFGTGGLAARMGQGSLLVDMTSGLPETTRTLATRLADLGVAMIDAPVSGGVARARTGELSIMAGGEAGQLDAATPALECLGRVTRTGPVGTGHAMKALNNLVSAGGFLIGIEALVIGMKAGIDPDTMVGILNEATGMNNSTKQKFRQFVLSRSFNSGFALDLMAKDLTIAMSLAHDSKAVAPFAALCREIWAAASTTLGGNTDHTELARFVEGLSAVELRSGDERAAS